MIGISRNVFISLLALALLSACAQRSYVALLENADGTTGKVFVRGSQGEQSIEQARHFAPLDGSKPSAPISEEKIKQDFSAAMAARPTLPERFLLYFESGGAKLTAESQALLPRIIDNAGGRPGVDVSVIGHTDTVGKPETNEALALKRAETVAEMIRQKGIKVYALIVESHGERNLLIATPDETAEPRNRRVEVSIR